jgi:hypothetical protein
MFSPNKLEASLWIRCCVALLSNPLPFSWILLTSFSKQTFELLSVTDIAVTLREIRRLKVFENRVLRRVFGPRRDEVTGDWRKLHNDELNDLCSLPNIVRVVK